MSTWGFGRLLEAMVPRSRYRRGHVERTDFFRRFFERPVTGRLKVSSISIPINSSRLFRTMYLLVPTYGWPATTLLHVRVAVQSEFTTQDIFGNWTSKIVPPRDAAPTAVPDSPASYVSMKACREWHGQWLWLAGDRHDSRPLGGLAVHAANHVGGALRLAP
jgi:hypothetical protein